MGALAAAYRSEISVLDCASPGLIKRTTGIVFGLLLLSWALIKQAHAKLLEGYSCTAVVTQLAESKVLSRRTTQRTVQQAYALIREDIDQCNVERTDLVAQAID